MNSNLEKALFTAAALIFEELGFMLPTLELDEVQVSTPPSAAASVDFHGPFSGRLEVRIYGNLLPTLAANMLGEEVDVSHEQQMDALRELVNVICGNMLPEIGGTTAVFNIGTPRTFDCRQPLSERIRAAAALTRIGVEQGRAELLFFLEGHKASETQLA